jgi:hypothetical protein
MNTTTAATVKTFSISDSESVQVDRTEAGEYVVRLVIDGATAQERWAFGSREEVALQNGKAWASSMRVDRAWMTR